MDFPLLSLLIFLPLLGMVVVMALPKNAHALLRWTSVVFTAIPLVLSLVMLFGFDWTTATMQFTERFDWIPQLNIQYSLGVDGISVPLLVLTTLLSFLCVIASFNITKRVKEYMAFFLLLETGMIGVFCALDFFLFYVFWEVMLVPMYFLIGIWGGPRREYAAIKFFLYTLFGSIFMLVAILGIYFTSQPHTFDMMLIMQQGLGWARGFQIFLFVFFFIAFAIKVPIFPFHTWLPDAHVEAPTAVSVILAGVLLKMGTYGILRVNFSMLPDATQYFSPMLAWLGVIAIIYGALVSMAQKDLKKLVAYSSVSHMGYCILAMGALTTTGIAGAMFQMISHGLITGALFLLVGVLYDRAHTREIAAFGGLWTHVPVYSAIMTLFAMASLGLPGLSGFVAEFMSFVGAFQTYPVLTAVAVLGVLLTAAYILRMIQRMFLGPFDANKWGGLTEISMRELFTVTPLALLTIYIGLYPKPLANLIGASVEAIQQLALR
jgi:NADH-quinone oxidoreductase subunit M